MEQERNRLFQQNIIAAARRAMDHPCFDPKNSAQKHSDEIPATRKILALPRLTGTMAAKALEKQSFLSTTLIHMPQSPSRQTR
ncbi:hypothetical protein ABHF33_08290 [Chitinibacter sp. FCG-7]|uniref:Uncharacterized protein n=1 Tax=Chitinibacter mangrovi TaxID=3153927 RepID=A0AAU7FET0_9NEIS